jgi:predicted glycogen debranching enzyme
MTQSPRPDSCLLKWCGDKLRVSLSIGSARKGRAAFRTNITRSCVSRQETIAEVEEGVTPLERDWVDIPMVETSPGEYSLEIALDEVGTFAGKAYFAAEDSDEIEWPRGGNFKVKVESAEVRSRNSIYTVFPRQFGSFREVVRRLPVIMDRMGFRIIQTLPPFPVPVTYAVMGEFGCPFASTDFKSVDPAMAEFDEFTTPLDQFGELVDAVHARKGLFFIDLPANHTGWGSTLHTHHPEWFKRDSDGKFKSPGAWGVVWADLVELDYANRELAAYMAEVFLFWCRNGVDGFRCDAGYMIAADVWRYIVAKVRDQFPDTVFMLEGLGGDPAVTDGLLGSAGIDWAYSELFQTYDRGGFDWYLPQAIARSEKFGTLVHFAETHDNDRLAKGGETYARLRVQLAALLSWQGAWGIANGVEWYCREKIDVHGKNDLNWGSSENMVELIGKLNFILSTQPSFCGAEHLELVTAGGGNVLAVKRSDLLVLANLDCNGPSKVDWCRDRVTAREGFELISERKIDISSAIELKPGEVMCLKLGKTAKTAEAAPAGAETPYQFAISLPQDARCDKTVAAGGRLAVFAQSHFRFSLVDPSTGKTLAAGRSQGNSARVSMPGYAGDGTRSRELRLDLRVFGGDVAKKYALRLFVAPGRAKAKVRTFMDAGETRRHGEYRGILSNGAGAVSQVRAGWGEIYSQYDALLSVNPNENVPADRINVWSRCRVWLQREGFSREFDRRLVTRFEVDPAGSCAGWTFSVPAGMGLKADFRIDLALAKGKNAARMTISRLAAAAGDVEGPVRLVLRPDIEWRSYHEPTKAYLGAEHHFPKSVSSSRDGFVFKPCDRQMRFSVKGGVFNRDDEWTYNLAHAEEAERGLTPSGDVYSPGWIAAELDVGGRLELVCSLTEERLAFPAAKAQGALLPLGDALGEAMKLFIVRRDALKTVIAGYPWFLDWGRDTFIFMRGMIAAGMRDLALKILKAFAAFEDRGTLPNIIYGNEAGNRDTTDAQLWFIECVKEMGGASAALKGVCESIVDNYLKGTPNSIKVDPDSALVWSPAHFTWMDTNYPAATPRAGYPVEIQALWISALRFLGRDELADKALASLKRLFRCEYGYRDCLMAPNGERAADATPDDAVRPNQLLLVTLGVLDDASIIDATRQLLVPGAIRTLDSGNSQYRGVYTGDENTSRKLAYHNGTAWPWPFPSFAEAAVMCGRMDAESALGLLSGAVDNLNTSCLGHMSEIADGDSPHAQKGCAAQAWSVSELLRVWLKLSDAAAREGDGQCKR